MAETISRKQYGGTNEMTGHQNETTVHQNEIKSRQKYGGNNKTQQNEMTVH